MPRTTIFSTLCAFSLTIALLSTGCGSTDSDSVDAWSGTIDTLASGEIIVQNTGGPVWSPEEAWQVVEEVRIGRDTGEDALLLGSIGSFDVDSQGWIYALDGQTQAIHVFDTDGILVQTVGGEGTGPGEFERANAIDLSTNGQIWVMEMQKGRLTFLDTSGNYLNGERINSTGWDYRPYPGGMDPLGRYNAAVVVEVMDDYDLALARFNHDFVPLDTIPIPESSEPREQFELITDGGGMMATSIPFRGSFVWRFSPSGHFWTLLTDKYELAEITADGATLRRVTLDHDPIPVTPADLEEVRENLSWFTRQGGKIDWSKIPDTKPVTSSFFCDDEGNLWVMRLTGSPEDEGFLFDLFDVDGRFLGAIRLPFSLDSNPEPTVRNGLLYGITTDELGAENIVRAQILKP
ncbi:MAG: 6-bladed beta-propeller [Bacteroidetes bacterium]|nr:6-bladed beta-propeller [Bacteroidota bacterium]MDE2671779.1 6-bladed beta-propeller [Bacteroidota bacterium]